MSTKYTQIRYAMAPFEGGTFQHAGKSGDWLDIAISFQGDLPVKLPNFVGTPRVIITPVRNTNFDPTSTSRSFNVMTPVCVARDVTPQGFRLAARNADPDFGGFSAFNWIAIEEAPGVENSVPALQTGVFPPRHFAAAFESGLGNRTFNDHVYYGMDNPPISLDNNAASVQLTATDQNVAEHEVTAVGMVNNPFEVQQLDLAAHNVDLVAGGCAFYGAAFSYKNLIQAGAPGSDLRIDTGQVDENWFEPSGQLGDWQTWNVGFATPFNQLPVVLLTPYKPIDIPVRLSPAVLGMVQALTTRGFRIAARNSDIGRGLAGFFWVAIGK
jgi:hypothetical protein